MSGNYPASFDCLSAYDRNGTLLGSCTFYHDHTCTNNRDVDTKQSDIRHGTVKNGKNTIRYQNNGGQSTRLDISKVGNLLAAVFRFNPCNEQLCLELDNHSIELHALLLNDVHIIVSCHFQTYNNVITPQTLNIRRLFTKLLLSVFAESLRRNPSSELKNLVNESLQYSSKVTEEYNVHSVVGREQAIPAINLGRRLSYATVLREVQQDSIQWQLWYGSREDCVCHILQSYTGSFMALVEAHPCLEQCFECVGSVMCTHLSSSMHQIDIIQNFNISTNINSTHEIICNDTSVFRHEIISASTTDTQNHLTLFNQDASVSSSTQPNLQLSDAIHSRHSSQDASVTSSTQPNLQLSDTIHSRRSSQEDTKYLDIDKHCYTYDVQDTMDTSTLVKFQRQDIHHPMVPVSFVTSIQVPQCKVDETFILHAHCSINGRVSKIENVSTLQTYLATQFVSWLRIQQSNMRLEDHATPETPMNQLDAVWSDYIQVKQPWIDSTCTESHESNTSENAIAWPVYWTMKKLRITPNLFATIKLGVVSIESHQLLEKFKPKFDINLHRLFYTMLENHWKSWNNWLCVLNKITSFLEPFTEIPSNDNAAKSHTVSVSSTEISYTADDATTNDIIPVSSTEIQCDDGAVPVSSTEKTHYMEKQMNASVQDSISFITTSNSFTSRKDTIEKESLTHNFNHVTSTTFCNSETHPQSPEGSSNDAHRTKLSSISHTSSIQSKHQDSTVTSMNVSHVPKPPSNTHTNKHSERHRFNIWRLFKGSRHKHAIQQSKETESTFTSQTPVKSIDDTTQYETPRRKYATSSVVPPSGPWRTPIESYPDSFRPRISMSHIHLPETDLNQTGHNSNSMVLQSTVNTEPHQIRHLQPTSCNISDSITSTTPTIVTTRPARFDTKYPNLQSAISNAQLPPRPSRTKHVDAFQDRILPTSHATSILTPVRPSDTKPTDPPSSYIKKNRILRSASVDTLIFMDNGEDSQPSCIQNYSSHPNSIRMRKHNSDILLDTTSETVKLRTPGATNTISMHEMMPLSAYGATPSSRENYRNSSVKLVRVLARRFLQQNSKPSSAMNLDMVTSHEVPSTVADDSLSVAVRALQFDDTDTFHTNSSQHT